MGRFPLPAAQDRLENRPLASLIRTSLEKLFHSWFGVSGQRYICSVYAVGGPPAFDRSRAVVAAVRREATKAEILFVFDPGPDEDSVDFRQWTARACASGANEWHVHLLAETAEERAFILGELSPARRLAA